MVKRFKVWSCYASLSVGIFPRTPSESLDGRGIETSSCGKLPLDRPFRQPSSAPKRKIVNLEQATYLLGFVDWSFCVQSAISASVA